MITFKFDPDKAISAILYVSNKLKDLDIDVGFHKLFKILYFADQHHLASYGRPIVGDYYVAMNYGPVPSHIYDILKSVKGDSCFIDSDQFAEFFDVNTHNVTPKVLPDLDVFSDSDLECLDESIRKNCNLTFMALVDKSHDTAYDKAAKDDKISFREMAKVVGADHEMLSYMHTLSENTQLFSK